VVENWRKMALFSRAKSAIYRAWSRGYLTQAIDLATVTPADFLAAESRRNVGAPFLREGLFRRDAEAVYARTLLNRVVLAGRSLLLLRQQLDELLQGGTAFPTAKR
jgi:hypothetical protein